MLPRHAVGECHEINWGSMHQVSATTGRSSFQIRAGLLFGSFLLLFSAVFARCAWLTVVQGEDGASRQSRYALAAGWVPARRGEIRDARGIVLARDRSRWIVAIDPS